MVAVALVGAACDGRSPAWNEADHRRIYEAVLQSMRSHLSLDTLVVDPRPRFLVEEAGSLSMGDYSRYGDPYFSEAIRNTPAVTACDIQRGVGCDTSCQATFGGLIRYCNSRSFVVPVAVRHVMEDGARRMRKPSVRPPSTTRHSGQAASASKRP